MADWPGRRFRMRRSLWYAGSRIIGTLIIAAAMILLAGCPPEPEAEPGIATAIDFDTLTVGSHSVGDTFNLNGVRIVVLPFVALDSTLVTDGTLSVTTDGYASGTFVEIFCANVNVGFDFGGPITGLSFQYGEMGGSFNIEVNGTLKNQDNPFPLTLPDITDSDTFIYGYAYRKDLSGAMVPTPFSRAPGYGEFNLIVGGQELAIDNVVSTVD
jgi:hypothetical protein